MYAFENIVLADRRGQTLATIGDFERPTEKGAVPFAKDPTLRQALLHMVEVLPQVTIDAQRRQQLSTPEFMLRDRIARALTLGHEQPEPKWIEIEDEHRNRIVKWFELFAPQIFGADLVPISNALEKGKLGKAPTNGNTRGNDRDEARGLGRGENNDGLVASAGNGNHGVDGANHGGR